MNVPPILRRVGITYTAAYFAVTVAYAVVIPFGWWERNVLAFGLNWMPAAILALATLVALRSRRPAMVHAVLAVPVIVVMLVAMVDTIPSQFWPYWVPLYLYMAVAWAVALPVSQALIGDDDGVRPADSRKSAATGGRGSVETS